MAGTAAFPPDWSEEAPETKDLFFPDQEIDRTQVDRTQVDLHDEGALESSGLESSQLVKRIQEAHVLSSRAPAQSPTRDQGARALSELSMGILEHRTRLRQAGDSLHLQTSNLAKLLEGKQPHGFPSPKPSPEPALKHLLATLRETSKALNSAVEGSAELERLFILGRRAYEAATSEPGAGAI